jgi:hypothetical protein
MTIAKLAMLSAKKAVPTSVRGEVPPDRCSSFAFA